MMLSTHRQLVECLVRTAKHAYSHQNHESKLRHLNRDPEDAGGHLPDNQISRGLSEVTWIK